MSWQLASVDPPMLQIGSLREQCRLNPGVIEVRLIYNLSDARTSEAAGV